MPLSTKNRLIQKDDLGLVAYVQSSCDTPSGRDEYVSELMKHIKVDSYGHCLHNKDLPNHLNEPQKMKDPDFLHILAQYKFVLAIENAVCPDYITEKLWKVLQVSLKNFRCKVGCVIRKNRSEIWLVSLTDHSRGFRQNTVGIRDF